MQEYLEAIKIKFVADEESYKLIQEKLKDVADDLNNKITNSTVKLETESLRGITDDFIYNGKKILDMSAEELSTIREGLSLNEEMKLFEQLKQLEKDYAYLINVGTNKALEKAGMVAEEIYALNELLGRHDTEDVDVPERKEKDVQGTIVKYEKFATSFSDGFEQGNSTMSKTFGKATGDFTKLGVDVARAFAGDVTAIEEIATMAISKFAKIVSNGLDELDNITSYSTLSNSEYRELAFGYGLSSSEAYGVTKAMEITGLSSEEDVIYAIQENGVVGQKFLETFQKYSDKYNKLYDSGTFNKILEYNIEMEEFQQDLKLQVVDFFMENKELIKFALDTFMTLAQFLMNTLGVLADWFLPEKSYASSIKNDTLINNASTTNNNVSNVSVKIDNTFNSVEREDKQYLTNVGLVVADPLVKILEGGRV